MFQQTFRSFGTFREAVDECASMAENEVPIQQAFERLAKAAILSKPP